jgi:DNA-binding transcriptional LysR family regulator
MTIAVLVCILIYSVVMEPIYTCDKTHALAHISCCCMHLCMSIDSAKAPLDWALLRSFVAVMRHGTLSTAAIAIGQTQPTIGRHIRSLEEAIGEPLFLRRSNSLTPTDRALVLFERASVMEEAAFAVERDVAGGRDRGAIEGTVRLSVPEVFGNHLLPPVLARFHQVLPGVAVELIATNSTNDLLRREADIAVRLYRPRQPDLVMAIVGKVHVGLYATPDYLQRFGKIESLHEFSKHRLIGEDQGDRLIKAMVDFGLAVKRSDFVFRSDSILAQIAATEAGLGLGAGMTLAFDKAKVVRVLPDAINIPFDVHVVAHADLHRSRLMRALFDHLVAELKGALRP